MSSLRAWVSAGGNRLMLKLQQRASYLALEGTPVKHHVRCLCGSTQPAGNPWEYTARSSDAISSTICGYSIARPAIWWAIWWTSQRWG